MHAFLLLTFLAQGAIAGTVRADSTRTPIPFAVVEIEELGRATTTDADGYYVLAGVPAGTHRLRVSALGYESQEQTVTVAEGGGVRVDFDLSTGPLNVEGVQVRVQRSEAVGPPPVRIDLTTLKRTPTYAEPDILRAAQMTPAAQPISDFSSALYLRGGAPDQTLITLDGIPLFNPYHSGGFLSAFTAEAVESVEVQPGGFGAGLGDRLSGAVSIRTRDAERDRLRLEGGIGLLSVRSTAAGPLPWENAGVVVSGRHSFSPLSGAIHAPGMIPKGLQHNFSDLLVRFSQDVGLSGTLGVTGYVDTERIGAPEAFSNKLDYDWDWGTRMLGLRFRYPVSTALHTELRAGISAFDTGLETRWRDGLTTEQTLDASGQMRDALVAGDARWHGRFHTLTVGAQLDDYRFDYSADRTNVVGVGSLEAYVPEFQRAEGLTTVAAYVEEEIRPHPALTGRAGVRFLDAGSRGQIWLPRFGLRLDLIGGFGVNGSAGRHAQVIHSLRAVESSLAGLVAYEIFAAAPESIGIATADEVTVGLSWSGGRTTVRVDGYVRELRDIPLAPLPGDPLVAPVVAPDGFVAGEGYVEGVEVLIRHARQRGGLWVSYAYQDASRTQQGVTYSPRFERQHFIDGMLIVPVAERTTVSTRALYGSGQPYTPTVGYLPPTLYDPVNGTLVDGDHAVGILGEHNSARLRPYFRMDLGLRHNVDTKLFGKAVTLEPYVQVVNVTLRDNELTRARATGLLPPCRVDAQRAGDLALPTIGVVSCTSQNTHQLPLSVSVGVEWDV